MNKATRTQAIQSAVALLDSQANLNGKPLASGKSYFDADGNRIVKVVATGRLEININLPEAEVQVLSGLNFQDWSNKPRSGVRFYGEIGETALQVLVRNLAGPKALELSSPEATAEPEVEAPEVEQPAEAESIPAEDELAIEEVDAEDAGKTVMESAIEEVIKKNSDKIKAAGRKARSKK